MPQHNARSVRGLGTAGVLAAALAGALAGGCGSPPGVIFEQSDRVYQWPAPPDEPRVRYVGQLRSQEDLKPGESFFEQIGGSLFGREPGASLSSPSGVCTDGASRVFIADGYNRVVHVMDLASRQYKAWAPGEGQPPLQQPVAVAFMPAKGAGEGGGSRLLVADSAARAVVVFDEGGRQVARFGEAFLQRPCGVAADVRRGRVLVADAAAHQVVVLNESGSEVGRLGERGSNPGQFNFPTNVAVGPDGSVYVSDSLNFRVQVFDPELKFVRAVGRKGDMPGTFAQPKGVALDPDGHLFVVDSHFENVQLFDEQGRVLMSFGHEGSGPGEFWLPGGIFIDPKGRVWIADSYNRRVQVFDYLPERKQP